MADAPGPSLGGDLSTELDALSNPKVEIIHADQDSMNAVGNPLAGDTRAQAARAGRFLGKDAVNRTARPLGQQTPHLTRAANPQALVSGWCSSRARRKRQRTESGSAFDTA